MHGKLFRGETGNPFFYIFGTQNAQLLAEATENRIIDDECHVLF